MISLLHPILHSGSALLWGPTTFVEVWANGPDNLPCQHTEK